MRLTQKQLDDLASWVKASPIPGMNDWETLDSIKTYLEKEDYEYIRGELCADHDLMDAYR